MCEFLAFFVGSTTNIPALQSFCLTASIAVVFDYIFQILAFVAFLTLDEKRKQAGRLDVFFCVKAKKVDPPKEDRVKGLIEKYYIPCLFSTPCKVIAFITFFGLIGLTFVGYQNLTLGLEQQISFIEGSPIYNVRDTFLVGYLVNFCSISWMKPSMWKLDLKVILFSQELISQMMTMSESSTT